MSKLATLTTTPAAQVEAASDDAAELAKMIEEVKSLVQSGDIDLAEFETAYEEMHDEPSGLTKEQIIECVARVNDDDNEAIVALMREMVEQGDEATGDEPEVVTAVEETREHSQSLADKLAADDTFKAHVETVLSAKEIFAAGAVSTLIHLNRLWNADDWQRVPVPGTKQGETGNKPWDITVAKEGKRKVNISWFKETIKVVNPKLFADLADVQDVLKKPEDRSLINDQRKGWANIPILKKLSLLTKFQQRIGAFNALLQKAVSVQQQCEAIRSVTGDDDRPVVGIDWDWADKKKKILNNTTSPILVWDETVQALTEKVCDPMTVTSFLKLKVDEWKKLETDEYTPKFNDLQNTLTRDKTALAAAKLANKFKIDNPNEFFHSFATLASYVDNAEQLIALKRSIVALNDKADATNPKLMTEKEQEVWLIGEAWAKARPLYDFVKGDYEKLFVAVNNGTKIHPMDAVDAELDAANKAKMAATG